MSRYDDRITKPWPPEPVVDTERGAQFASLTDQGQAFYADRRSSGAPHDAAYADAKHSYGVRRSKP